MLSRVLVLGRYKEIWYGIAIGISMWILDAMMHASSHGLPTWSHFTREVIASDSAQLLFRALFVLVSLAFGVSLWRSNQRKHQARNLCAGVGTLYSQIANPLVLIVGYSQILSLKEGWPVSREEVEILKDIQMNARRIDELIKRLPPPGMQIHEGTFSEQGSPLTAEIDVRKMQIPSAFGAK